MEGWFDRFQSLKMMLELKESEESDTKLTKNTGSNILVQM